MNIKELYNSKAIALVNTEAGSNKVPYLGAGLFPSKKKMGLDLKWIKTSKGLGVSLAPSNFDAVSKLRAREGFKFDETEMAFFRESMLLKEVDRQEILRIQDSTDPYAQDVIARVFDDAEVLIEGADVVPERMRMQLLHLQTDILLSISQQTVQPMLTTTILLEIMHRITSLLFLVQMISGTHLQPQIL